MLLAASARVGSWILVALALIGPRALAQTEPQPNQPQPSEPRKQSDDTEKSEPGDGKASSPLIAIVGARILTVSGPAIEKGTLLMRDGKIEAIGESVQVPGGAEVIDGSGKTIAPGFIDASSHLYLNDDEVGSPELSASVVDGFDTYQLFPGEALAQGVTTVYTAPSARSPAGGAGAVIKPSRDRGAPPQVLADPAAISLALGASRGPSSSVLDRIGEYEQLDQLFEAAKKYQEAWEKYRKELEEYEKSFDEYLKKLAEGGPPAEEKKESAEPQPEARPEPPAGFGGGRGGRRGRRTEDLPEEVRRRLEERRRQGDESLPTRGAPGGESSSRDDRPKRPQKPALDPSKERLVLALEKKIPVRILATRRPDIEAALRVADRYGFRLILEHASESPDLAPQLAARGIPVIAGPVERTGGPRLGYERHAPNLAAELAEAELRVAIGSCGEAAGPSRFLRLMAARAVGFGLDPHEALKAITLTPAELLGVSDRVGSLEPGKDADIVVLDGDPLGSSTRIEQVFVQGVPAFRKP